MIVLEFSLNIEKSRTVDKTLYMKLKEKTTFRPLTSTNENFDEKT